MSAKQEVLRGRSPETRVHKNREIAIGRLNTCLEGFRGRELRPHQLDFIHAVRDHFKEGKTAGYVSHPTGSGKTRSATELAQILGLRTVILSPTQTILRQTGRDAQTRTSLDVRTYYAYKKDDVSEGVVNTTYQSIPSLVKKGELKAEEVDLLICDELHTTLGEQRHTLFRQFPNALMVGFTATPYAEQLKEYVQRGLVDETEPWLDLFREQIHEMSLEEAMEKEILVHLDAHLVETNTRVEDIKIQSSGDYSKGELERCLNTAARNALVIGMVVGVQKLPENVELSPTQMEEIKQIHELVKGKRTFVFGISIEQIDRLCSELRERDISAEAVHSKVPDSLREDILDHHSTGDLQVVGGVDALRIGVDSPATEVGIFMAPTHSGIVALQELGRILRPSPQTGKKRAIAIQLVDTFQRKTQSPVLIPNIFDPYYVLRGTQTGKAQPEREAHVARENPIITFSGMNIEVIIEQARSAEMLQRRFKQSTLSEMNTIVDAIIAEIHHKDPNVRPLEMYRQLVDALPNKIPLEKQEETLQGLASIDSNTVSMAKKVLLALNMKSILSAVEQFFTRDENENEELLDAALVSVFDKVSRLKTTRQIGSRIYSLAERGAAEVVAQRENMPMSWVLDKWHSKIKQAVEEALQNLTFEPSEQVYNTLVERISSRINIPAEPIAAYLRYRSYIKNAGSAIHDEEDVVEEIQNRLRRDDIDMIMQEVLSPREQMVVKLYYGSSDPRESGFTYLEIADELGLSSKRVSQICVNAITKLGDAGDKDKGELSLSTLSAWRKRKEAQLPFNKRYPIHTREYQALIDNIHNLSLDAKYLLSKNGIYTVGNLWRLSEASLTDITTEKEDLYTQILSFIKDTSEKWLQ